MKRLENNGIKSKIYYPIPLHKQKLYIDLGYTDNLPISEKVAKEVLSIPIHPSVNKTDLELIANLIKQK